MHYIGLDKRHPYEEPTCPTTDRCRYWVSISADKMRLWAARICVYNCVCVADNQCRYLSLGFFLFWGNPLGRMILISVT